MHFYSREDMVYVSKTEKISISVCHTSLYSPEDALIVTTYFGFMIFPKEAGQQIKASFLPVYQCVISMAFAVSLNTA